MARKAPPFPESARADIATACGIDDGGELEELLEEVADYLRIFEMKLSQERSNPLPTLPERWKQLRDLEAALTNALPLFAGVPWFEEAAPMCHFE